MSSSALFEEAHFSQKKSQKLEGLCSNTNAAQPKKPTIQT